MGLDTETWVFTRAFALPLDLQLEMFRSAQGFTDSEIRDMEKTLEGSGRIEKREDQYWVNRTYQNALIAIKAGG